MKSDVRKKLKLDRSTALCLVLYAALWLIWAAWTEYLAPMLPPSTLIALVDSVILKALVWVLPFVLLRRLRLEELVTGTFPWLACFIILCGVAAFLHTIRLINGLQNTHIFFDPMFIVFSLSAGVWEELSFRGGFFTWLKEKWGFWPAALVNGLTFTLYHYPELICGNWYGLVSWRSLLIFVMGVFFCWMFKKWRNLALNMTVHSVWDILSYLFCLVG